MWNLGIESSFSHAYGEKKIDRMRREKSKEMDIIKQEYSILKWNLGKERKGGVESWEKRYNVINILINFLILWIWFDSLFKISLS